MTLVEWLDRFPPCLCRMLARKNHGRRPLTQRDLVKATGLSMGTICKLSTMISWKGVRPEVVDAFARACGVNHFKLAPQLEYLRDKRNRIDHIRQSHPEAKKMYARIQKLLKERNAQLGSTRG